MHFQKRSLSYCIDCRGAGRVGGTEMRGLLYKDTFPRLVRDIHDHPGKWASRLVLLLGPWTCLWMVEALNENDVLDRKSVV